MLYTNLEDIQGKQLSDTELDAIYLYLDMYMESMKEEEKLFWLQILANIDKEFYDGTSNGTDGLQDVQSPEGGA